MFIWERSYSTLAVWQDSMRVARADGTQILSARAHMPPRMGLVSACMANAKKGCLIEG